MFVVGYVSWSSKQPHVRIGRFRGSRSRLRSRSQIRSGFRGWCFVRQRCLQRESALIWPMVIVVVFESTYFETSSMHLLCGAACTTHRSTNPVGWDGHIPVVQPLGESVIGLVEMVVNPSGCYQSMSDRSRCCRWQCRDRCRFGCGVDNRG
jgi:hypothetical protein